MNRILGTIAAIAITLTTSAQINSQLSKVDFKIGNMGFMSVEGSIGGMKGDLKFDANNLNASFFDVTIDPASIDTESEKRDEHLKNEDFFNVEKYLTVHFKSTEVLKKDDAYLAKGYLTLHGVKKMVEIPFSIETNGSQKTFKGEFEVDRNDYNLGTEAYSGSFMVDDIAEVVITCVFN